MSDTSQKECVLDGRIKTLQKEWDKKQREDFTKWMNTILCKENLQVKDLCVDLRDGVKLTKLLEILTGEQLGKTKGQLKAHQMDNINRCLNVLRRKKIRVDGVSADQVVAGSVKDTISLVSIIYVSNQTGKLKGPTEEIKDSKETGNAEDELHKAALLKWCKEKTLGYSGIDLKDFSLSWRNGLAFNALVHVHRQDLVNYDELKEENRRENLQKAFDILEKEFALLKILSAEDVDREQPDEKAIVAYVALIYQAFYRSGGKSVALNQSSPPATKPKRPLYGANGPQTLVLASNGPPKQLGTQQLRLEVVDSGAVINEERADSGGMATVEASEVSGEESFRPVVFTGSWACDCCSFTNIPSTRICAMCYKSKSEKKVESNETHEKDEEVGVKVEEEEPKLDGGESLTRSSSAESIDSQEPKWRKRPEQEQKEVVEILVVGEQKVDGSVQADTPKAAPRSLVIHTGPTWSCPGCHHHNPTTTGICAFCFRTLRQLKALSFEEMGVNKSMKLHSPINETAATFPPNATAEEMVEAESTDTNE